LGGKLRSDILQAISAPRRQHQIRAASREQLGELKSDPRARSSYQRPFPGPVSARRVPRVSSNENARKKMKPQTEQLRKQQIIVRLRRCGTIFREASKRYSLSLSTVLEFEDNAGGYFGLY